MKRQKRAPKRRGWAAALGIQILEMLAAGGLTSLSAGLHPMLYGGMLWVGMPLAGCFSACRAVRRGLLNYAGWIAPPACLYAAHIALWGYAPAAGPALVCALVSLVGAAAGEVLKNG